MEWAHEHALAALEQLKMRQSCRNFLDKEIPDDLLKNILQSGLQAASGGNLQPYSIIVIKDKKRAKKLRELNGDQRFIEEAPINLLFLLDWYKIGVYSKLQKAPYQCNNSFMHFLIGLEDVMCTAQTIESAAHLCGIGSCYVGTSNFVGEDLAREFNLPEHTYPVILLSLGYPKLRTPMRSKLDYDIIVFDENYPELSGDEIFAQYEKKYEGTGVSIPKPGDVRDEMLRDLRKALETTYSADEVSQIMLKAEQDGRINMMQRTFGLHYHAADMQELGVDIIRQMGSQKLTPFNTAQ